MLRVDSRLIAGVRSARAGDDLCGFVQSALELEHSTIPPYLTAFYTLRPGTNGEIAAAVREVVVEEMLHMTIAGNLILALGGQPRIATATFVPRYPTVLPMNIGNALEVPLAPYSTELVRDVFMRIEEPEDPLHFPQRMTPSAATEGAEVFATIGEFYTALCDKLVGLGDGAFVGDPALQVVDKSWFPSDQLFRIVDVSSAVSALTLITQEGEGTTTSPLDREGQLAHYYRFAELAHGRRLVPDAEVPEGYSYSGDLVPFEPEQVWPMPANPRVEEYPRESRQRFMAEQFAGTYTRLLRALQQAFSGAPETLGAALGLMFELRLVAQDVLATPGADGRPTGLCFQYRPNGSP